MSPLLYLVSQKDRGEPGPEASVELLTASKGRAKLRTKRSFEAGSKVRLEFERHRANGVVRKCKLAQKAFVLDLKIDSGMAWLASCREFDPGALTVDKFLSEDQLALLLTESGTESISHS